MTLDQARRQIRTLDQVAMEETQKRLDSIAHPLGSLGKLESSLVRIAGMSGNTRFDFRKKAVAVFCADNGVVAQGVTQTGQEVTAIVTENLTRGETSVCIMGAVAGADIVPIDIGIARDLTVSGVLDRKIAYGTRDFSREPAMTRSQAVRAIETGIDIALDLHQQGYSLAATGEMGIGNTTSSAAITSVLLRCPPEQVTGRGAGLSTEGLRRKTAVIADAIRLHQPDPDDPIDVLAKVGGFDIGGMAGLCIGGAVCGMPIVLDGIISCVAATVACRIAPGVRDFLLASHTSAEPAGALLLQQLDLSPLLDANMRLGEGTGAVSTFPLYDMIAAVYHKMVNFEERKITPYEKLV